jgi:hypothetical protein
MLIHELNYELKIIINFQSIFKNSQNSTEDDLLLQMIIPINPQNIKDICLFKESFTKRETFKGNSLSFS